MNRIQMLMKVFALLPPQNGWTCFGLTDKKVKLRHPVHGDQVYVRGGIPKLIQEQ